MSKKEKIDNLKFKILPKISNQKIAILGVLFLIYIILLVTIFMLNVGRTSAIYVSNVSVSGVITAVQLIDLVLMTVVEYYFGGAIAIGLCTISFTQNVLGILRYHNYSSLPGTINYLTGIITVYAIRAGLKKLVISTSVDGLTGILNRRTTLDSVDVWVKRNSPFYVIIISLDHFKNVNDSDGHEKGDEILKNITKLWTNISQKDYLFGRVGGDEFLLAVPKGKSVDIENIAEQYLYEFNKWKINNNAPVYLTLSIGISSYPENASTGEELISKADRAMQSSKKLGHGRICMYTEGFDDEILRQTVVERRIVDALDNDKFYMVYQPQFETDNKNLRGFEALIRMNPCGEEVISPGEFIPVSEKSDLIIKIGNFVLNRATHDFSEIVKKNPSVTLSINISAKQLLTGLFVDQLKNVLAKNAFPPANLEIEITEYCLLDATEEVVNVIQDIKNLGIKLAMDDFGTGYSSFLYLTKLPIDLIKIDKSIIDTMEEGVIVDAIVSMGHALDCEVISEGVEEERQIDILKKCKCDLIQGFVWGKPMSLEDAKAIANADI